MLNLHLPPEEPRQPRSAPAKPPLPNGETTWPTSIREPDRLPKWTWLLLGLAAAVVIAGWAIPLVLR